MDLYPVQLNLKGKKVVVIGGGKIAERKITGLINTGADVTVVSPEITDRIQAYIEHGKVTWRKKTFSSNDLVDAFLIISATNESETNMNVKNSVSSHQLVSIVDHPDESDFILPSVMKRGKLSINVSTSGASPILTKKIKQELEEQYGIEYKDYVDFLYECRRWILQEIEDSTIKKALLTAITEPSFFKNENREQVFKELVNKMIKKG